MAEYSSVMLYGMLIAVLVAVAAAGVVDGMELPEVAVRAARNANISQANLERACHSIPTCLYETEICVHYVYE